MKILRYLPPLLTSLVSLVALALAGGASLRLW